MDAIKLFGLVALPASELIKSIQEGQWENGTPCTNWSVRDLVGHMTSEVLWVPDLLAGRTVEQVGNIYDGDVLGREPVKSWLNAVNKSQKSIETPGAMDHQVHLSYGERRASDYIAEVAFDIYIHSWDLAKGIECDFKPNKTLVKIFYKQIKAQQAMIRSSGLFGPELNVDHEADLQTKLLALVGRKA